MNRNVSLIAAALALAACMHTTGEIAERTPDEFVNGETAFHDNCAKCHETGSEGAPRIGEPGDWAGRSNLWQAVLMEHAKSGYLDMPARGGTSDLPDAVVEAAAEYMLEQTFPDRPED